MSYELYLKDDESKELLYVGLNRQIRPDPQKILDFINGRTNKTLTIVNEWTAEDLMSREEYTQV